MSDRQALAALAVRKLARGARPCGFVLSDRCGDVDATPNEPHGLFLRGRRFLSRWVLTVNGRRSPRLLSVEDHASSGRTQFFMALSTGSVYAESQVTVLRRRSSIGRGFQEELVLVNHGSSRIAVDVRLEAAADFADFASEDDSKSASELYREVRDGKLVLGQRRADSSLETHLWSSRPADVSELGFRFRVDVVARDNWATTFNVVAR